MQVLAGDLKGRTLKSPKGQTTRPTAGRVKKSLFDILSQDLQGAHFLDLFAGTGQMGIEALSRGASFAAFVENNRSAYHCLTDNIKTLALHDKAQTFCLSVERGLKKLSQSEACFDIIFLDPPYGKKLTHQTLKALDTSSLFHPKTRIFIEESSEFTPPHGLENMTFVDQRNYGDTSLYELTQKGI